MELAVKHFALWPRTVRCIPFLIFIIVFIACTAQSSEPISEPWATTQNLPNPPRYIRLNTPFELQPTRSTITVDPERPFYTFNLRVDSAPGVVNGETDISWVAPEQPISATFRFENGTTHNRDLTILCLMNYQQVPCREHEDVLSVIVSSGEIKEISVQVGGVGRGAHVFAVAAFSYLPTPSYVTDSPERIGDLVIHSSDFFWSEDVILYAGDYKLYNPPLTELEAAVDNENTQGDLTFFTTTPAAQTPLDEYVLPSLIPNSNFQGQTVKVRPGEEVELHLISGHSEQAASYVATEHFDIPSPRDVLPFVVTAFLDTKQIPISSDLTSEPLFGHIPRGHEVVIPLKVIAPTTPGIYSIAVLFRESPFLPRGQLIPQNDGGLVVNYVGALTQLKSSNRVIIEVVP
jgi:hypothetical protein